jgi:hypothetical protein
VKIPESFFFFLLLLLSWAKKQKILLLVFSDEPRGENKREMKKSKKNLHTVTIYINCAREEESHQNFPPSSSSCFSEGTSSSQQLEYWTDRTNSL